MYLDSTIQSMKGNKNRSRTTKLMLTSGLSEMYENDCANIS